MPPPCSPSNLLLHLHFRTLATSASSTTTSSFPAPDLLLRLCTILYQQQHSPTPNLHSHLSYLPLPHPPSPTLFLAVCARFLHSWKPVYCFHLYLTTTHRFSHTPTTLSQLLHVLGNSRNIPLLFHTLSAPCHRHLLTPAVLRTAARPLAASNQLSKCAAIFRLSPSLSNVKTLNTVVETLSSRNLVYAADTVVSKLTGTITPDSTTYRHLIVGFCRAGDIPAASKVWNKMVECNLNPEPETFDEFITTMFKNNQREDGMRLFKTMGDRRRSTYNVVISWMSKGGRVRDAYMVFAEMLKRGVGVDSETLGGLAYANVVSRKVREGYRVVEGAGGERDIAMYHGMMKGLLRLRRAREATGVLREMIARGCEPNMHTYIMLLQGHMGKKGRKGRDPAVNFESIFVGGLVKLGRTVEAVNYMRRDGQEPKRFDYNSFLHYFSNEEGVVMFEEVGKRLREVGMVDLGDTFLIYGERMATRDRRRKARLDSSTVIA